MFSRPFAARFGALVLGGSALLWCAAAAAHQVWIEPEATGTKLYFGEFGDNLHEVSPGYLDKLAKPSATLLSASGPKVLPVTKQRDGFAVAAAPAKGESLLIVDAAYPLIEGKDGDEPQRTAWTPAARFIGDLGARTPQLTLDVVPTGTAGEFQVFFRGKPLAKVELTLTAGSGWSRQGTSDGAGKVRFTLPWKGKYGLLVRHKEDQPGSRAGAKGPEAFEKASFGTTLTFVTREGLPSPPSPPPAAPNALPAAAPSASPPVTPAVPKPAK
jgi:uncharacterized GH25 family protein